MDLREKAETLNGEFNVTPKGTERIIVQLRECKASIVYVEHSEQWKLFRPFPAAQQERLYFSSFADLEAYVADNR